MTMTDPKNTTTITTTKADNADDDSAAVAVANKANANDASFAKKALLAANFFVETNRMESFVAVYCITYAGWNEVMMGIISLATNVTMIVFQTPAGDLLDKTRRKKIITTVAILTAAVTTACIAWTTNFWIVLTAKIVEGVASTVFLPALMAILLGICHADDEVPSFVAKTEVSNKVGSVLFTLGCGLAAYFLYPNLQAVFYLLGAGGLFAALAVSVIPASAIDYNKARKLSSSKKKTPTETTESLHYDDESSNRNHDRRNSLMCRMMSERSSAFFLSQELLMDADSDDDDDSEDDDGKEVSEDEREEIVVVNNNANAVDVNDGKEKQEEAAATSTTEAASPKRYLELLKDRNILAFMVSIFFYHLSNAAVQPLVSQYIAIEDERNGMVFVSAIMLVFYFAQGLTAHWMIKAINGYDRKRLLLAAHSILPIQSVVIAVLINFWPNAYALTATQLLVGFSAGIFDTMIPVVVGTMTDGSGRYGFTFGFAITCWRLGHGCSVLLGESIVHASGYTGAFLTAAAIGLVSVGVVAGFVRVDNDKNNSDDSDKVGTNNEKKKNRRRRRQQKQKQLAEDV